MSDEGVDPEAVLESWVRELARAAEEILADIGPPSEPVALIVYMDPDSGLKHLASVFGFKHIEGVLTTLRELSDGSQDG